MRIETGAGAGLRFVVGPGDPLYASGTNELAVQEALRQVLKPGATFLDIGANVGFFTVIAARLVGPAGRVTAFEPVAANARLVRRNVRINRLGNVVVREAAVAASTGEAELVLARYAGGAALAAVGAPPDATRRIRVPTTTIDAEVARGSCPPPDAAKIDVEGAEYEVLLGMEQTLRDHRPVLLLEFDGPDEQEVQAKIARCTELLEATSYRLTGLPDSYGGDWVVRHLVARPVLPSG